VLQGLASEVLPTMLQWLLPIVQQADAAVAEAGACMLARSVDVIAVTGKKTQ